MQWWVSRLVLVAGRIVLLILLLALDEANSLYAFCPSLGAAILFAVLYCLTTLFHIFQAVKFRTAFCWVIIMSGTWQTVAYIFRSLSILSPTSQGFYDPQFILILVAPLWTNAFVFMVLGRLVHNCLPDQKLVGIKGRWFGYIFVTMDIM